MLDAVKTGARRMARAITRQIPGLSALSGRFGLGRFLAPSGTRERLMVDSDIVLELDLSIPIFRYMYFHYDPAGIADLALIKALARPDLDFVDVGAQIGEIGLIGAKYFRHAYFFEPNRSTFARLERNIALNAALAGKITARSIAISAENGQRSLFTPAANPGVASFHALAEGAEEETVQTETLDTAVPLDAQVGFLKIDVEGAELDVLAGATRVISRDKPWMHIELVEENQRAFGRSCADVIAFLEARAYTGFAIEGDLRMPRLADLRARPQAPGTIVNGLFSPSERVAELDRWRV